MKLIAALPTELNHRVAAVAEPKLGWQSSYLACFCLVLAIGVFLRLPSSLFSDPSSSLHRLEFLHPQARFIGTGFDEKLYGKYVDALIQNRISSYPDMVEGYIDAQKALPGAILPPVRFLYVFTAYIWHSVFGGDALESLREVSALFTMLTLGLATVFAWRLRGHEWALAVAALMAFAPTQIHMSQHALIDGVFAFWALLCVWLLWENLRAPHDWRWLVAYSVGLSLLILTKENSFFVWIAIVVLLAANRWLQFGTVTRELLLVTVAGSLLGVVTLVFLAGGLANLIATYQLLTSKAAQTPYAILTGDGPWYRYIVDLSLVSPLILILALGCVFRLDRTQKPELYMSIFVAASYLVMCNVKYGMNLRYANMWDMPMRFIAFSALVSLTAPIRRYRNIVLVSALALICAVELRQYIILAVQFPLYEMVSEDLLRALHILKSTAP
jgi:4-amino-4-deoxy-L-arabinose transferase-like glycosyltransferase